MFTINKFRRDNRKTLSLGQFEGRQCFNLALRNLLSGKTKVGRLCSQVPERALNSVVTSQQCLQHMMGLWCS